MLPEWEQKYSINNEKIDHQHKRLFELAAKVEEMSDKPIYKIELKKLIADFFNYIKIHFHEEEAYMKELNYPYLNQHKLMHQKITKSMIYLIQEIKTTNDLKEKLYIVVNSWLIEHILQHDMMIEHWRKSQEKKDEKDLSVEKQKPAVFFYHCNCEKKKHKVPYDIHLKIQYTKVNFKCKECNCNLKYIKE
ncbi:bacteriohemerythrin [Campylobacter peloridis]|uniref:Hemerythrin-like metal-binding domain protein n=1 Tax=Campylobacter peloridis TaxID=488546 RepID=A0ABX6TTK1_9BACT|nr:hemerythrin-like metal-binding domain protein [Campylobacter peloridis]AJC85022.1 hemerythrin-like metal-binding domain protein [Campylobacter peloridis LMG 23910]MBX1885875.1 hemerythrin-like metal-binding domain protein [Campylobacter peloridis]MBX2078243.1 hemerythrin-like metal-binding domain protein [Campylobacter peloridis]QOQ89057.1 hemerythrin-like metal-binding domain protein [Campylobacter peloridis]